MNKYVKKFIFRGLIFAGFGPVIAAIIYLFLYIFKVETNLSGLDIFSAIISTYLMAFIHAGTSVFYKVEKWSKLKALLFSLITIYVVYLAGYFINNWLPFDYRFILIFTGLFIVSYLIVWFIVYFITKRNTNLLNERLKETKSK